MKKFWLIALAAGMTGCQTAPKTEAPKAAAAPAAPKTAAPDDRPVIACFGDSLTAGFGLDPGESFPDLLQKDLDARGHRYRVATWESVGTRRRMGWSGCRW